MSQPHIQELGAFDPIEAFCETFARLARLYDGLREDPQALPHEEIIRAVVTSVDLLDAISETTIVSMLATLRHFVPDDVYDDARTAYMVEKESRTPEEAREYKMTLMRKVSQFIPHEMDLPKDDGPTD